MLIFSDIPSSSAEFRLKLRIDIGTFFRLIDVIIKAILKMVTEKFVNCNQIFFLFNIIYIIFIILTGVILWI